MEAKMISGSVISEKGGKKICEGSARIVKRIDHDVMTDFKYVHIMNVERSIG